MKGYIKHYKKILNPETAVAKENQKTMQYGTVTVKI